MEDEEGDSNKGKGPPEEPPKGPRVSLEEETEFNVNNPDES